MGEKALHYFTILTGKRNKSNFISLGRNAFAYTLQTRESLPAVLEEL